MTFIRFDRTDLKVDDLLLGDVALVSPPEVYARLTHLLENAEATLTAVVDVIEHDPALAARLLRLANSPFFALLRPVLNVSEAIALIGIQELKQLVLATEVIRHFDGIPANLIDIYAFWRQSVRCAVLARLLADRRSPPLDADAMFVAALLHGVGHLVIYARLPELGRKTLLEHRYRGEPLYAMQREFIGFDYAQVGEALARRWRLPELFRCVIAWHIHPEQAESHGAEAALVHLALAAGRAPSFDREQVRDFLPRESSAWELAGITHAMLEDALSEAEQDFLAALALLR